MSKFKKPLIFSITYFVIFTVFLIPVNFSLAQCLGGGSCTAETAKIANPVPADQCKQNEDSDKGLIQCGRKIKCEYETVKNADGTYGVDKNKITRTADPDNSCDFDELIFLIDRIIKFILGLAVGLIAIMFMYAGFLLITSGGDTHARTKAKEIFLDALIGLVIAFAAFLIVQFLFWGLGYEGAKLFGF